MQYAEAVVDALSDQVQYWMTFNEPQCFIMIIVLICFATMWLKSLYIFILTSHL